MREFKDESTLEVLQAIEEELVKNKKITIQTLDPDVSRASYAGEKISGYIYRSLRSWVDLANILQCKISTPIKNSDNTITFTLTKLQQQNSFHKAKDSKEKYGAGSEFFKISKFSEPSILYYYKEALFNVGFEKRVKILNLGVNRGDEFEVIRDLYDIKGKKFLGVDFCRSAIEYAKEHFCEENFQFLEADISQLKLEKNFDLIISIGTLQSSNLDFNKTLMDIYQNFLSENGAIILGFPNSRWIDGELIFGAKAPNYSYNEMSLVLKDLAFAKKYLQQKKMRVTITGKDYLFLTATKIGGLDANTKW